jgi:AraC-like DNA-binding protein
MAPTDPLSDVLRAVRLTGGVFLDARFTAPWSISANMDAGDCKPFLAMPAQLIAFHVIIEGRLLVWVKDEPPIEVRAGELVLFPRNDGHFMASAPGLAPIRAGHLIQASPDGGIARIVHGGGGEATHLVCGFLATEDGYNPLIAALPSMLTLDIREATSRDWIETSVKFAASELVQGRLATSSMVSRLSESLLVEAVRHYSATQPAETASWMKGLQDQQIGRALVLIHRDIAAPWSTDALAKEVALSRSAFVQRFTSVVGTPPIQYLTKWRLQTAQLNLRESKKSIAQVAHLVGYESEEAFSRAFKREFGVPPARWRDQLPSNQALG